MTVFVEEVMNRKYFPGNLKCYDMKILMVPTVHKFVSTVHLAMTFLMSYKGNVKIICHVKIKIPKQIFPVRFTFP